MLGRMWTRRARTAVNASKKRSRSVCIIQAIARLAERLTPASQWMRTRASGRSPARRRKAKSRGKRAPMSSCTPSWSARNSAAKPSSRNATLARSFSCRALTTWLMPSSRSRGRSAGVGRTPR